MITTESRLLWDAETLLVRGDWRWQVPADVAAEIADHVARHPDETADEFVWDPTTMPHMTALGARLQAHLRRGDGVALLQGLEAPVGDDRFLRVFFVALGSALGRPMLQYGRLYPVIDRGRSYEREAIPVSMTSAPTGFHTDSSARGVVPDFVGLLCEQPALLGGDSLVSNAIAARRHLEREHPESLALLEREWIRDLVTPGAERTEANMLANRFPVFEPDRSDEDTLFRYMRYWIEKGQAQAGQPVDDEARLAFDRLDAALAMPEHKVRFRMERGDILFVNNRALAHDRTGYEDQRGAERRLQRMWIEVVD